MKKVYCDINGIECNVKFKKINSISQTFSKSGFRQQKIKYVLLIVMLMRLDRMIIIITLFNVGAEHTILAKSPWDTFKKL